MMVHQGQLLLLRLLLFSVLAPLGWTLSASGSDQNAAPLQSAQQLIHLPRPLVGIVFDMDGTLVEPCIDFAEMRRRIYGIASLEYGREVCEGDVVELAEGFPSEEGRAAARAVFDDIEERARREMKLMPGMVELCRYLDESQIRRALLTRNVRKSVEYLEEHHLRPLGVGMFAPAIARDSVDAGTGDRILPKPEPDAIWQICREWGCDPSSVMMVGDSDKDDIVAANRANCGASCWLRCTNADNDSGNAEESCEEERRPTVVIESLGELQGLLEEARRNE